MKMSRVLTDNIQRGYSLHESLVRGETWRVLGLISVCSSPLKRAVYLCSTPLCSPSTTSFPPLNRAYWMSLKFKQDSKPSLSSPSRASLSCVWPHSLHKMESRQMSVTKPIEGGLLRKIWIFDKEGAQIWVLGLWNWLKIAQQQAYSPE